MVSQTLIKKDPTLKNVATDIRNGIVSSISQDINKRRDAAVQAYSSVQQGPEEGPSVGDVQKFADNWLQQNVPLLLEGVEVDKDTGAVKLLYMGQTPKQRAGMFRDFENPDGSPYLAKDYSSLLTGS